MADSIQFIFRKKLPQFNSIEGLFEALIPVLQHKIKISRFELPYSGAGIRDVWLNLVASVWSKKTRVHITGHVNYVALVTGSNTILTIHDIGSALRGSVLKQWLIKLLWFWLPILRVRAITVISEFSKNELIDLAPFAAPKIKVIHNAVNPSFQYLPKEFDHKNPQILLIGTKANKNLERTLAALEGLKCNLKIIGPLTEKQIQLLAKTKLPYTQQEYLSFEEVLEAYATCDLLCFASLYEGFGMPIIEAQAVGRPVLTSHRGSMVEVAGLGACFVDPEDPLSIRQGVEKIIYDPVFRTHLIQQGLENVKKFSVENIAAQYLELYQDLN